MSGVRSAHLGGHVRLQRASAVSMLAAPLALTLLLPGRAAACMSGPLVAVWFEGLGAGALSLLLLAAAFLSPARPERNLARRSRGALRCAAAALQASLLIPIVTLAWPPAFPAALAAAPTFAAWYVLRRLPRAPCLVVTLGAGWLALPIGVVSAAGLALVALGWRWLGPVWAVSALAAPPLSAGLLLAAELRHAAESRPCRTFEN